MRVLIDSYELFNQFGQLGFNHATATSGPHDVKVQMKAVGMCGSDVHHFKVNCLNCHTSRN
ncbi:unnamed protein product [Ilex paraguariensis]|uniref:Uncharacterized protein n=1 Tax=Ilex paraguariensis TaxID=185542 RepID=A0ABC8TFU8_9AQUA